MPTLVQIAAKCEKQKKGMKRKKSNTKYPAMHFLFFAFCDKCIAGLTVLWNRSTVCELLVRATRAKKMYSHLGGTVAGKVPGEYRPTLHPPSS